MALIDWLKSDASTPPRRVDAAPSKADRSIGSVRWDGGWGSAILSGPDGDVALVWDATDDAAKRALPPASYRIRTLRIERIERTDASDESTHWFVSSTGPAQEKVTVKAGMTAKLEVSATVHFEGQVKRKGGQLQLGFSIKSKAGRGLSVYRSDARVKTTYEILDRKGKVLASGPMNYG